MTTHDRHQIKTLVDKLTLESLALMEQHIALKIELERCMVAGEGHMSKARYIMGHKKVSQLQLPTEESDEFHAVAAVNYTKTNVIQDACYDLEFRPIAKRSGKEDNDDPVVVNPVSWFGILVPQSLHFAQDQFKQTLHWSVRCTNVQRKLSDCLETIVKLNKLIN